MARKAITKTQRLAADKLEQLLVKAEGEAALTRLIRDNVPDAWHRLETDVDVAEKKIHVTLRLDESVAKFFRAMGSGYQSRINRVLATYAQMKIAGFLEVEDRIAQLRDESAEAFLARMAEDDAALAQLRKARD